MKKFVGIMCLISGILLAIPACHLSSISNYGFILAALYLSGICMVVAYNNFSNKERMQGAKKEIT